MEARWAVLGWDAPVDIPDQSMGDRVSRASLGLDGRVGLGDRRLGGPVDIPDRWLGSRAALECLHRSRAIHCRLQG